IDAEASPVWARSNHLAAAFRPFARYLATELIFRSAWGGQSAAASPSETHSSDSADRTKSPVCPDMQILYSLVPALLTAAVARSLRRPDSSDLRSRRPPPANKSRGLEWSNSLATFARAASPIRK